MSLYNDILLKSKNIDWSKKNIKKSVTFKYKVAKSHKRYKTLKTYEVVLGDFKKFKFRKNDLILVDKFLLPNLSMDKTKFPHIEALQSSESETKTLNCAERMLIKYYNKNITRVVSIGGGVILDFGSYIAEQTKLELILVPTTIIAMCDASTGGKVRMNFIDAGRYIKHYYKSFYEPDKVIVDFSFLQSLSKRQIAIGLAEPIKHAFAQSPKLVSYLSSNTFNPFTNFEDLKRVILWTIDLKKICLSVDPEETTKGSHKIIYLAHTFANKIEEDSLFKVSHGEAVEQGLLQEFADKPKQLELLKTIYSRLEIM